LFSTFFSSFGVPGIMTENPAPAGATFTHSPRWNALTDQALATIRTIKKESCFSTGRLHHKS
jgi:hypothetical protein